MLCPACCGIRIAIILNVKRVLVLDDNPFIRYLFARTLQSAATVVLTFSHIEKAVAEQQARHCDLFFVDMQTLNHSAMEMLRLLKKLSPHAKIVIMSATFGGDELPEELQKIIYCFIAKPFLPSEIRQLARKSMGIEHLWEQSQMTANRASAERRQQSRRHERKSMTRTIDYTTNAIRRGGRQTKLRGQIINISDSGLGMLTEYPITSGSLLTFCDGIEHDEGIVVWSRQVGDNTYSAGVVFV